MKRPELIIEDMKPQDRPVVATRKELRELADDIDANGLKYPILVMDDTVIDGLKRIEAFKLLGRARIPALITTNFGEAAMHLVKVRAGGDIEPGRKIELVEQLEPYRQQHHRLRYYPKLLKENHAQPWGSYRTRQLLAMALGAAESYAEAMLLMVKVSATDPEVARRLALVKKGQDTIHGVYHSYRRNRLRQDHVSAPVSEIRTVVNRGIQTMTTTLEAMNKYGSMLAVPSSERIEILKAAEGVRQQLFYFAKGIKEGLALEAKEGQEG